MMEQFIKALAGLVVVVGLMFVLALLLAYPIMWTWNYTFPTVFGVPEINVWQALWGSVCVRLVWPVVNPSSTKK